MEACFGNRSRFRLISDLNHVHCVANLMLLGEAGNDVGEKVSIGLTFDVAKNSWILRDPDVHVSGAAPDATYRQLRSSPEPGTGNKMGIRQAVIG